MGQVQITRNEQGSEQDTAAEDPRNFHFPEYNFVENIAPFDHINCFELISEIQCEFERARPMREQEKFLFPRIPYSVAKVIAFSN